MAKQLNKSTGSKTTFGTRKPGKAVKRTKKRSGGDKAYKGQGK